MSFVTLGEQDALAAGGYVALAVCPIRFGLVLRGGPIELEQMGSADPPLAVHCLYGDRHRQLRRPGTDAACRWVTYSPLLPLALLLFTGLYLFVLPYATKWRSGRRVVHQQQIGG